MRLSFFKLLKRSKRALNIALKLAPMMTEWFVKFKYD